MGKAGDEEVARSSTRPLVREGGRRLLTKTREGVGDNSRDSAVAKSETAAVAACVCNRPVLHAAVSALHPAKTAHVATTTLAIWASSDRTVLRRQCACRTKSSRRELLFAPASPRVYRRAIRRRE
jgi:hypothetical protein